MAETLRYTFAEGAWIDGTPYRVVRPLGIGGMAEVYEVDHTRTGTRRAVKLLREAMDPGGTAARRLLGEARLLTRLDHPNVVRVYEAGTIGDGRPFFAMQLLEGITMRMLVADEAPIEPRRAARLVAQALEGLEAAHACGVVHRDVKPTNLFVGPGERVRVLDFGVAKVAHPCGPQPMTAEGVVLGTLRYMAPEQLLGQRVDARADVYAAGLVLFELLTGRHAFEQAEGGGVRGLARARVRVPSLRAVSADPSVVALDPVLGRALAVHRSDRFPTAGAFARALRAAAGEPEPTVQRAPFVPARSSAPGPDMLPVRKTDAVRVSRGSEARAARGEERRARWRSSARLRLGVALAGLLVAVAAASLAVHAATTGSLGSERHEKPRQVICVPGGSR
jgi:serine/threonine-protein kinase